MNKFCTLSIVLIILVFATSACDVFFPPSPIDVSAIPLYPGAEQFDPVQNSQAADRYRQDRKWTISGHKASVSAYALPKGTTSEQVRAFYKTQLAKFGKISEVTMPSDINFGEIDLDRGMQSIFVTFDAGTQSPSPTLLIENYTVNGCAKGGSGCTPGPEMVHTCPTGMELKTVSLSRPSSRGGTTTYFSDYCFDAAGKRYEPGNAYATPTP